MRNEKGQFTKGNKAAKGRPKGKPNKVTTDLRTFVDDFLNDNRAQLKKDFKALEPYERMRMYERLLSYVLPKKTENDLKINPDNLSDQAVKKITDELLKNL